MRYHNTDAISSGGSDQPSCPYSANHSENKAQTNTHIEMTNPQAKFHSGITGGYQQSMENAEENAELSNENVEEFPEFLQTLLDGNLIWGDSGSPFVKPDWFDMDMFLLGRQFGVKYSSGVMFADLISLIMLFVFKGGLEPLIFTGKSDTPFKAFKRYLSTAVRVNSWYETDIWDVESLGHKNLKSVRGMHEKIRQQMTKMPDEELAKKVSLVSEDGLKQRWTTNYEDIKEDFQSSCPNLRGPPPYSNLVRISQADMAVTQFGFVGLILLFPKMFGIHSATRRELESFAHFWRTIGYLLGIEDRFNLCGGDLDTVQQRCKDIIDYYVIPSFRGVSLDWIHMMRCVSKGASYYSFGITFEVILLYLCSVLNIATPRLIATLNFWQKFTYYYMHFVWRFLCRLPGILAFHNRMAHIVIKKALVKSPEELIRLEQKDWNNKNIYPKITADCDRL